MWNALVTIVTILATAAIKIFKPMRTKKKAEYYMN